MWNENRRRLEIISDLINDDMIHDDLIHDDLIYDDLIHDDLVPVHAYDDLVCKTIETHIFLFGVQVVLFQEIILRQEDTL